MNILDIRPKGFVKEVKISPGGEPYRGRFTCPGVQWTGSGEAAFCTFTVTAGQIADAALSDLIWTDQAVQRGIKPGTVGDPPRELSLREGYPDNRYVFDASNADDIVNKLLIDDKLFLSPLIWNLRPGQFEAFYDAERSMIYIYGGKFFLPDSHHRHQALFKAVRLKRDDPSDYSKFDESKQFKVELYFLTRDDEGNYFFDKNQRPKPTALSKAFDLSTVDDLSVLAKSVISQSEALRGNVNRVTDRLVKSDPSVVTLSTIREVMKSVARSEFVEETELEGLAFATATFFDSLSKVRPEIGHLDRIGRNWVREHLLVDAAVMFHGFGALASDYLIDIPHRGSTSALAYLDDKLQHLSSSNEYRYESWTGDLFDKNNPVWEYIGVLRRNPKTRRMTTLNTGAARGACQRIMRRIIRLDEFERDLLKFVEE